MEEFKNVNVVRKGNIYFEGKVVSRTIIFSNGEKKTLGFMQVGEYEFQTTDKEIMEIISGSLEVTVGDSKDSKKIKGGESFEVPANSKFKMNVLEVSDYICHFIKD